MKFKLLLVLLLCSTVLFSQEDKLKLHSISFTPVGIYFDDSSSGVFISSDIGFSRGKHIFKIFGLGASEVSILSGTTESFFELSLIYGREFRIEKWFYIDAYAGGGYFKYKLTKGVDSEGFFTYSSYDDSVNHTIGLHLQSRLRFQTGKYFSLGLQANTNINPQNSIYNLAVFLQWKFKNSKSTKPKIKENSN